MSAPFSSARRYRDGVRSGWYDETVENAVLFSLNERFFMFGNIKLIVSVLAICAGILLICCLVAEVPIMLIQMAHTANHALI